MHAKATTTTAADGKDPRPLRLLTAEEVGEILGVKATWVYAQARAKRIPHVPLGRYTRFSSDSIALWAAEREQGPIPARWEAPMRSEP
jgi:excisionase family DNA binding protein